MVVRCVRLARMRCDNRWIRAASRLDSHRHRRKSASESDDHFVHVFACLTNARLRHLFANTRSQLTASPYERSLTCSASPSSSPRRAIDPQLGLLRIPSCEARRTCRPPRLRSTFSQSQCDFAIDFCFLIIGVADWLV